MKIEHNLTQVEISDFFMKDPKLSYLGLSDDDLLYMYNNKEYEIKPNSTYGGIYDEERLILIFKWELYSSVAVTFHMYLASDLHLTGTLKKVGNILIDFFVKNTSFKKVIIAVPFPCTHVIKAARKMGFLYEATVKKVAIWRKELVDVVYYTLNIEE